MEKFSLDALHWLFFIVICMQSYRLWGRGQRLSTISAEAKALRTENSTLDEIKARFVARKGRAKERGLCEWGSLGGLKDWGLEIQRDKQGKVSAVSMTLTKPKSDQPD